MIVVEFQIDTPILQESLTHTPRTIISYEELYQTEGKIRFLFWAEGGDLTAFEDGLTADPTVANPTQLTETQTRRLYRVTFTEYGESVATSPFWPGLDISLLHATTKTVPEGWIFRMRMPDRETLQQFHDKCEDNDTSIHLKTVYQEEDNTTKADAQLTSCQQEALVAAHDLGYFQIPRRASLADVSDHCDISSQALSERLRRGTATLIQTSL